ncbi:MAG: TerC family protein [Betaproteobacteria bacterium]|nr:MAG: TerC family protein [Betaproteobacteria bacterium]
MELLTTSFFWVTLAQITMINILLSGDNAVVIALASRSLPPKQQKQAILFGSFGAIILRVILTFFAVYLLELPFLKIVGALALIWIGIKMLIPEDDDHELNAHDGLWEAVKTIIIADFVMSLDNVLGVAAAAKGNVPLLVIGLAISIPLIIYGSTLILKLMNRFSFIVTAGGGLLGWVAGEMLVSDPAVSEMVNMQLAWAHTGVPVMATFAVIGVGKWLSLPGDSEEPDVAPSLQAIPVAAGPSNRVSLTTESRDAGGPAQDAAPGVVSVIERTDLDSADAAPVGYRWVSSRWHTGADGRRDYAAMNGQESYRRLAPSSSHLRAPRSRHF